ncbi:MAG TPA: YfiR family protein [Candidatus Acidoferrum sp.]
MIAFSISDSGLLMSRPPDLCRSGAAPHPRPFVRIGFAFLVLLLYLPAPSSVYAQSTTAEYQLKAAFIFHFVQLVDWPPEVSSPSGRPLILCIADENALPGLLERTVQGKQIASRPLYVRHLLEKDNPKSCDLLFVVGQDKKRAAALLRAVNNAPILTVGESEDFIQQGGMIGFCLQENKIRFDINLQAAKRANLTISSRLLLLAKSVIGDSKQG